MCCLVRTACYLLCLHTSLRRDMNYLRFMERLLRLAVPNTAVWLAMFYLVFHLWLNILGELLLFGDRMFYKVRTRTLLHAAPICCQRVNFCLPLPWLRQRQQRSSRFACPATTAVSRNV